MLPDLFRRLKPLYGEHIDKLWIAYQLGSMDERRELEGVLTVLAVRAQGIALGNERIVLEPIPANISGNGEITLGMVSYPGLAPYPALLSHRELLRHVFLLGPSGTGKSTFILGVLRQLLRDRVPFWCVDFKRNYRCLLLDEHGSQVRVLSVGRNLAPLRVNVLCPPPRVSGAEWVEALSDIISNAYLLLHGARNVLKNALLGAITRNGTLRDARDQLAGDLVRTRSGSRRYGWMESAHRSLDELSKDEIGESLCAIRTVPLDELLSMPVVFELQGLGDDQKRLMCLYLLQYVLLLRKYQTDEREALRHVLVFDEAHNVFPKEQWGELGIPSRLAREVREYGEAIISATQQADVADSIIANSGTKIILRTDYPKDIDIASKLLQVDTKWVSRIPMGHAIIRLPTRYYQAFLITFTEQPLKNQHVPDELVTERYTQWAVLEEPSRAAVQVKDERSLGAIKDKDHALIADIAQHPISTVTQRYQRLGWNPKTGNTTKDRLLTAGMIDFETLDVTGTRVKLLTLTTKGTQHALDHQLAVRALGRPGLEHEFWRSRLTDRCTSRGYKVTKEYHLGNGKRADLHATNGKASILIEIETGKSDVSANLAKTDGWNGLIVMFFTSKRANDDHQTLLARWPHVIACYPETIDRLHALLRS